MRQGVHKDNQAFPGRRMPMRLCFLFIRTLTVGPGITPDLLTFHRKMKALAGFTAGGELRPALKTKRNIENAVAKGKD